ncbi:zinc knuckle, partial [Ostertagia ostertagi]
MTSLFLRMRPRWKAAPRWIIYNAQKVLSKFAVRIQRKVLEQLVTPNMEESQWKMAIIVEAVDTQISTEERIDEMVNKQGIAYDDRESGWRKTFIASTTQKTCMFCKSSEHRPSYGTIAERRNFLFKRNMCLNCGREGHWVKDCKREGYRSCGGKKHES